jgi:predicted membrane-bound mannosyltransferase
VARGGEPAIFYTAVLLTIEWPVLFLAAIGAVSLWRRRQLLAAFLLWDFFLSLIVYSWAGEKFAWLVLHPLLPAVLLAGAGIQAIWQAPRTMWRSLGIAATAIALLYVGVSSWWVNVNRGTDPREMLVSTQSAADVKQVADQVLAAAAARGPGKPPLTVTVDSSEGATFPNARYFRHQQTGYVDMQQEGAAPPTSDVVILTDAAKARLNQALDGYEGRPFDFRVWWVREYGKMWNPANFLRYVTQREVWNPTGGMKETLYTRRDGA